MTRSQETKLIREGHLVAEIVVTLIDGHDEWSPCIAAADVRKLDAVRLALRAGDIAAASKLAKVYELKPIAAE